ncbi:hypothetical protein, partial [Bradyrhizobium sp. STM 3809]|uniref:hypothetical protein n=1 Tax=Bradyrhizobium sp. STM 3809 TaxID=551936 RepID=UPI0005549D51
MAAQNALRAVQVKNTGTNVTINSDDIRDAVDAFVDLVERNPEREVHLRFLSTCSVGREQKREHRANGEPTLIYWRRAAAGADIQPLREVLVKIDLSDRVRRFVEARDDTMLRNELLRRIQWDCGAQQLGDIKRELEQGLLRYHVERFQSFARREQLAAAVVQRVFATIVEGSRRRLTAGELLALVTDTSSILVARTDLEAVMRSLRGVIGSGQQGAALGTVERSRFLEPERDLPLPPLLAERSELTLDLLDRARRNGTTFVTGSTGCGKTTVARLATRKDEGSWCMLDLRENASDQIIQRLDLAAGMLGAAGYHGIILDDLNEIE